MEQHTDYFMINMEEAKKIIARLIDLKYITGDEALILFEAINKPGEIKIEPVTIPIQQPNPHTNIPLVWSEIDKRPD